MTVQKMAKKHEKVKQNTLHILLKLPGSFSNLSIAPIP